MTVGRDNAARPRSADEVSGRSEAGVDARAKTRSDARRGRAETPIDVVVAGSFTLDPAIDAASFLLRRIGFAPQLQAAAQGPLIANILDPQSDLRAARRFNAIAFRWRDVSPGHGPADPKPIIDALKAADDGARRLTLICPDADPARAESDAAASRAVVNAFVGSSSMHVVDARGTFADYGVDNAFDAISDTAAQIPYTEEGMAALGAEIARWRVRFARPPTKLIAVDGDETLWGGVLGEAGVEGVNLTSGHMALQATLKAAADEGVALALVTKNEPSDIEALFAARSDFPLQTDDFHTIAAGWRPKADAIAGVMSALAVGPESVVFIDDNPVECAGVSAALPAACVARAPAAAALAVFAQHYWPLDRVGLTDADRLRAASRAAEVQRRDARAAAASLREFHADLDLVVDMRAGERADAARLAQMAARTNQFNSTLDRRELDAFVDDIDRDDRFAYVVSAKDRFGDYGVVGGIVGGVSRTAFEVDLWTLSCRALGRGVEHRIAARLGADAVRAGKPCVRVRHVTGPRNAPFRTFLSALADAPLPPQGEIEIEAAALAEVRFDPVTHAANDRDAPAPFANAEASAHGVDASAFERFASELTSGAAIVAAMRGSARPRPEISVTFLAPRPGLESDLADLWADILNLEAVGANDPLAALGAKSLHLVRAHARLPEAVRVRIGFADLFQFGTVRALADFIAGEPVGGGSRAAARGEKMRMARAANAARRQGVRSEGTGR